MSEILLRFDPVSGKVSTVEVIADDEKSQTDGIERLQYYMKDIYEFSRKTVARARLYRMLNPKQEETA